MEDFLDIILPPLLVFLAAAGFIVAVVSLSVSRTRLWAAERRRIADASRIIQAHGVLDATADILAAVISSPDTNDETRKQALTVYSEINDVRGRK